MCGWFYIGEEWGCLQLLLSDFPCLGLGTCLAGVLVGIVFAAFVWMLVFVGCRVWVGWLGRNIVFDFLVDWLFNCVVWRALMHLCVIVLPGLGFSDLVCG